MSASTLQAVADWGVTFAIHSTCALGLALVVALLLRGRALAWQELLLKFALWAAVLSSGLQLAFGAPALSLAIRRPLPAANDASSGALASSADLAVPSTSVVASAPAWSPTELFGLAILVCAVLGGLWLLRLQLMSRSTLRNREPETDGRVLAIAADVAGAFGLRQSPHLSRSAALVTPIAFGCIHPEVCLPARARTLDDEALRAMFAHEVAHLRRRDPTWMWLVAAVHALFWWQPLIHFARRRWAHLVELRCDAEAAERSSATAVARCLVDVATWLGTSRQLPVAAALGMAARPSALRRRVEAALHGVAAGRPNRGWSLGLRASSLAVLTFAAPGVDSAAAARVRIDPPLAVDATTAEITSPRSMLSALEAERLALRGELLELRAEVERSGLREELSPVLEALTQSLDRVQQKCRRLGALIDRRETEAFHPKSR